MNEYVLYIPIYVCTKSEVIAYIFSIKVKCHQYWPRSAFEGSNVAEYGPLRVKLVEESKKNHQVMRTFTLSKVGIPEERIVKQYHFTSWPDYGAPSSPGPLLEFVDEVRSDYNPFEGPMVVHCRLVYCQLKYEE